jgi:type II secretory pathway pseudopilin PulG
LLEVLIAVTIFSVGILGVMALQIRSIQNNSLAGSSTVAGAIARLHLENMIGSNFNAPGIKDVNKENNKNLNSIQNVDFRNVNADGKPVYWGKYDVFCNVADDTPIRNTKTLVVTVTWDRGRRLRRVGTIKSMSSGSIYHPF